MVVVVKANKGRKAKDISGKLTTIFSLLNFLLVLILLLYPTIMSIISPKIAVGDVELILKKKVNTVVENYTMTTLLLDLQRTKFFTDLQLSDAGYSTDATAPVNITIERERPLPFYETGVVLRLFLTDHIWTTLDFAHLHLCRALHDPELAFLTLTSEWISKTNEKHRDILMSALTRMENGVREAQVATFRRARWIPQIRQDQLNILRFVVEIEDISTPDMDVEDITFAFYTYATKHRGVHGFTRREISHLSDPSALTENGQRFVTLKLFRSSRHFMMPLVYLRLTFLLLGIIPNFLVWLAMLKAFLLTGIGVRVNGIDMLNENKMITYGTFITMIIFCTDYFDAMNLKNLESTTGGLVLSAIDAGAIYLQLAVLAGKVSGHRVIVTIEHYLFSGIMYLYFMIIQPYMEVFVLETSGERFQEWGLIRLLGTTVSYMNTCLYQVFLPLVVMAFLTMIIFQFVYKFLGQWKKSRQPSYMQSTASTEDERRTMFEYAVDIELKSINGLYSGDEQTRVFKGMLFCRPSAILWSGFILVDKVLIHLSHLPALYLRSYLRISFTDAHVVIWQYSKPAELKGAPSYVRLSTLEDKGLLTKYTIDFDLIGGREPMEGHTENETPTLPSPLIPKSNMME